MLGTSTIDRRNFLRSAALALCAMQFGLAGSAQAQAQTPGPAGEGNTVTTSVQAQDAATQGTAVRPFRIEVPEDDLNDLRRRLATARWPSQELVPDSTQG